MPPFLPAALTLFMLPADGAACQQAVSPRGWSSVELEGRVGPYEQVTLYAKSAGYLKRFHVHIGDTVRKGDLLAEIDPPQLATEMQEGIAALLQAKVLFRQAEEALQRSSAELQVEGAVRYSVAQNDLKTSQAKVDAAKEQVAAAEAKLACLEALRVLAPVTGLVSARLVKPGARLRAASWSKTGPAPLLSIMQFDPIRIRLDAPETAARYLEADMQLMVRVPEYPGESFPARVSAVDPGAGSSRVAIDVPNPGRRLRPGMIVKATLDLPQ